MTTAKEQELIAIINDMLPIVEAAYHDEHSAGMIPGSGYNHKSEHLAGQKWGWQNTKKFDTWLNKVKQLTKE